MTETLKIEKQVWESTLHHSMVLEGENEQLKEKIERLEKQLKIGVEALGKYTNKDNWQNHYTIDLNDWELELKVFEDGEVDKGEFYAQEALQQIKELENEKTPESI